MKRREFIKLGSLFSASLATGCSEYFNEDSKDYLRSPATSYARKNFKFTNGKRSAGRSRVTNLCEHLPHITDIQTFSQQLEAILSCQYTDTEYKLSKEELDSIQQVADEKFSQWEWTYGRSPKATLTHSARLKCGTVEVHLTLAENRIASCRFGGDFLGNLPVTEVESALKGVIYDTENISQCLSSIGIQQYFDQVEPEELARLMIG